MAMKDRFFSVLTELARGARQPMPLAQWEKYLQPGKTLERAGVRFPLRADEVKYGPLGQIAGKFGVKPDQAVAPADLASMLEQATVATPSARPEFRTLGPAGAPRGPWQDRATTGYMSYKDQYQLPGEKLGQAEQLTVLPGSDFVPSTSHYGGQPGLLSWSRTTRRPVVEGAVEPEHEAYTVTGPRGQNAGRFYSLPEAQAAMREMPGGQIIKEAGGQTKYPITATHLEEIQSDWHQRGREEGYALAPDQLEKARGELKQRWEQQIADMEANPSFQAAKSSPNSSANKGARWIMEHDGSGFSLRKGDWLGSNTENYDRIKQLQRQVSDNSRMPPLAPYEKTYPELELRKGVAAAVDHGDSYVTWTTGDQQADRWGQALRNSVDSIHWKKTPDGKYHLTPYKGGAIAGVDERLQDLTPDQLEDTVGKDIADKIKGGEGSDLGVATKNKATLEAEHRAAWETHQNNPTHENRALLEQATRANTGGAKSTVVPSTSPNEGVVSGNNLTVGGAGMRLFYDRKVPEAARKLAAQYGGEVTKVKLPGVSAGAHYGELFGDHPGEFTSEAGFNKALEQAATALGNPDQEMDHPLAEIERAYHDYQYLKEDTTRPHFVTEAVNAYKEATANLKKLFNPKEQEVWALKITPEMRKKVMEAGLPLFSAGAAAGLGTGLYGETGETVQGEPTRGYAKGGLVKRIFSAAVRDIRTGAISIGQDHFEAAANALDKRIPGIHDNDWDSLFDLHAPDFHSGYTDEAGNFLDRQQALERVLQTDQLRDTYDKLITYTKGPLAGQKHLGTENIKGIGDPWGLDKVEGHAEGGAVKAPAVEKTLADYFTLPLHPWLKYFGVGQAKHPLAPPPEVKPPTWTPPEVAPTPAAAAPTPTQETPPPTPVVPSTLTGAGLPPVTAPPAAPGGPGEASSVPAVAAAPPAPGGYLAALDAAETGADPARPVPGSTALGYYRFTDGTWYDVARRHPELGLTPEGRTNREQATAAALAFTADNAKVLDQVGAAPTDANLRVLHVLGARGGPALLYALETRPGDPAITHVSKAAADANPDLFYKKVGGHRTAPRTVRELYDNLTKHFPGKDFATTYLNSAPPATS